MYGSDVDISSNGDRLIVGAEGNDINGNAAGYAQVWNFVDNSWQQIGDDILGEAEADRFGGTVSMSSDGNRVAIGSDGNDDGGSEAGHVRVYEWTGINWIQIGSDIDGEENDNAEKVDISGDGNIIIIGAYERISINSPQIGKIRIYEYQNDEWVQIGASIFGIEEGDSFGSSVSISSSGQIIAATSPGSNINGDDSGLVKVFSINDIVDVEDESLILSDYKVYPNPTNRVINITGDEFDYILLRNAQGNILEKFNDSNLNVSTLEKGMYILQIRQDEKIIVKKILIQ